MKIKTGLMAILPIVVGSYALEANAVGKSYEYTANYSWDGADLSFYDYNSGNSYYLETPFFEFRPAESFAQSNQTVTGRFSYNTNAPISYSSSGDTWSYASYGAEAFSINLNSENGNSGVFNIQDPRASVYKSNYNDSEYHSFSASGGPVTPSISINADSNGCEFECWGNGFQAELPVYELQNDYPELFGNVYQVGVSFYDSLSESYDLNYVSLGLRADGLLPADNSLPDSLPAVNDANYGWLTLDFVSDDYYGPDDYDSLMLDYIEGNFANEQERYAKEQQIAEFVSEIFLENDSISVSYALVDLTELVDGVTPHNPILPGTETTPEGGFEFVFQPNETDFTFIDPEVAIGYDYEVLEGADFLAILLPEGIGDNLFDLLLMDEATGEFVDSGIDLIGGVAYSFEEGLSLFRIAGIETDENLDPDDPLAFVTGLKFSADGEVSMTQTAITQTVVPVPPSILLFMSGLAGLFFRSRKA